MIRFNSDYTEGCHTAILEKLVETNMDQDRPQEDENRL